MAAAVITLGRIIHPLGQLVFRGALHVLAAESRSSVAEIADRLRDGQPRLHARLRFLVARHLRLALREDVPALRDLRLFGSTLGSEVRPSSDLDLLVHLSRRDAAIEADIEGVGLEVSAAFRALMRDQVVSAFELVSLHFVTDVEVQTRTGHGASVRSTHRPSLRVEA